MQMTREQGEFYEIGFGLDLQRKIGPIYVVSFKWPTDYMKSGVIEIIDDKSHSLWRRKVTDADLVAWQKILQEQNNRELFERNRAVVEKAIKDDQSKGSADAIRKRLNLARPQQLSPLHQRTQFGLAHKGFYEIPIPSITGAFRYCLSEDNENSRLALCSRRYVFQREFGRYTVKPLPPKGVHYVRINDKPVTDKGTAIFLENTVPIKFSAMTKGGTYFEFVSNPKEIRVVDVVRDPDNKRLHVIGYGDTPMGQIDEAFYADSVHWGFLNFMPTIGDLRKFWRASISLNAPYLYLKGEGGAPFRQSFDFEKLPSTNARIVLSDKTTKSTYSSSVWVKGSVHPEIQLSADGAEVKRVSETEFEWAFPAPEKGVYNTGLLNVHEGETKWKAGYDIYRGYPAEIGARMQMILTDQLQFILLGELAGQLWFESILGWDNYTFSHQRWGVAAKYFQAISGTEGVGDTNIDTLAVTTVGLKYRITPGIWNRDPTVGGILSYQNLDYAFTSIADGSEYSFSIPVIGGGVFWARSMPKVFDNFFNLVPFMRYPKWVDWEFIFYPLALNSTQATNFMLSMNFHGKVQWTQNFYGEAGFGLKNFSFDDATNPDPQFQFTVPLYVAYGTLGLGFNF
jgi:hypothetical protein